MVKSVSKLLLAALLFPLMMVELANAQATGDAFSGFRSDNNAPIQIEADSLEVRDVEKRAVFKGNVDVRQGKTTMKTARLDVFYDGSVAAGGVGGSQGISRIEANGKVIVTSGNNTATGGKAVLNMKTQIVVLSGGRVVLTQCDNVIVGKKLTVNLTNNKASLSGGRVSAVLDRKNGASNQKKCS
ncbi:MAG: LptA/OstA family protein [Hyphomicrobiales bacterium]